MMVVSMAMIMAVLVGMRRLSRAAVIGVIVVVGMIVVVVVIAHGVRAYPEPSSGPTLRGIERRLTG
jgi:uncharacterized membrane protein YoaT (DUF817 family)